MAEEERERLEKMYYGDRQMVLKSGVQLPPGVSCADELSIWINQKAEEIAHRKKCATARNLKHSNEDKDEQDMDNNFRAANKYVLGLSDGPHDGVILAVDLGTSCCKLNCFEVNAGGKLVALSSVSFNVSYSKRAISPTAGGVEQDPKEWELAFLKCISQAVRELAKQNRRVKSIALSGQMQALVLMDDHVRSMHNALLFSDTRANQEAVELEALMGGADKIREITGNYKGAASILPKLMHLAKRGDLKENARVLFGAHSYIFARLTGEFKCDWTTAATTGLLISPEKGWATDMIAKAMGGMRWTHILPGLGSASDSSQLFTAALTDCGKNHESSASVTLGLMRDAHVTLEGLGSVFPKEHGAVLVFHGSGDLGSTTVGAAALSSTSKSPHLYMYVGTSGWIAQTIECPQLDDGEDDDRGSCSNSRAEDGVFTIVHPYYKKNKQLIRAVPTTTSGGAVEWFKDILGVQSYEVFSRKTDTSSLLFLPHLAGERAPKNDPNARGAFIGLGLSTTQEDMGHAVLEGLCFHFRWMRESLFATDAQQLTSRAPMLFVGGGSKSDAWCQLAADILGVPIRALENHSIDIAALGAACLATGISNLSNEGALASKIFRPFSDAAKAYSLLYTVWREAYVALRGINEALIAINREAEREEDNCCQQQIHTKLNQPACGTSKSQTNSAKQQQQQQQ